MLRLPAFLELGLLSTRTLVAQRTDDSQRAQYLGYIGVCLGLGLAVSPLLGMVLRQ